MLVRPTSRAACGSGQPGPRSPVVSFSDYSRDRNQSLHVAARTRPQDRNFTTTTRSECPMRYGMRLAWERLETTLRRASPLTFTTVGLAGGGSSGS